ncbi:MAG: CHAD domain-containing protein [Janthinobacterium lividum]
MAAERRTQSRKAGSQNGPAVAAREPRPTHVSTLPVPLLTDATPAAQGFVIIAAPLVQAALHYATALESQAHPENLHKLRISLRRLRSLIWAYEPLLDQSIAEVWREQFKGIADAAGRTRDWDILLDTLIPASRLKRQEQATLADSGRRLRGEALEQSREAVRRADLRVLLAGAEQLAQAQLAASHVDIDTAKFAQLRIERAARTVRRRARQAVKAGTRDLSALHRARIAIKKLRYLLEFFEPLCVLHRKAARRHAKRLAKLQTKLGNLNDLVVGAQLAQTHLYGQVDEQKSARKLDADLRKTLRRQAKSARKGLRRYLKS